MRRVAHHTADAARVIGSLRDGLHVTGVTAGQFSSIDAVEHVCNELGPCSVWLSTWTTGLYDVERAAQLVKNQRLLSVQMLVDRGTFEKSPKYAGPLIAALGVDAFRCLSVHAKVNVFLAEDGSPLAVMRSSMNLNKNLRTEQFDLSVCGSVAGFYAQWFEGLWEEAGVSNDNRTIIASVHERWIADFGPDATGEDDGLSSLSLGDL